MEQSYLIDRQTLGEFIDQLIAQKNSGQPDSNSSDIREQAIKELDDRIATSVFGSLTATQLEEINFILGQPNQDETVFKDFFAKAGINLAEKISEAAKTYSAEFLGRKENV